MTETRRRLERTVAASPGVHFNGLVRRLDLAPGQVQYHLQRLLREDRIVQEARYGRTHYYPPRFDEFERAALALLRRETARDMIVSLIENGHTNPASLADDLDLARSTVEWHLDRLESEGLLERRRDQHNHVMVVAVDPEKTLTLLGEIEPSLPERLTDRFTRLVDRLLDE